MNQRDQDRINLEISESVEPLEGFVHEYDPLWLTPGEESPLQAWRWVLTGSEAAWKPFDWLADANVQRLIDLVGIERTRVMLCGLHGHLI